MSIVSRFSAVWRTAEYNRDWFSYFWNAWVSPGDDTLLTFRLRNGQRITMRGTTRCELNGVYVQRVYDVPGVDLASCKQIFDFGSNMGAFALYASWRAPEAAISCFEPASANFAVLQHNLTINKTRAKAYQMAVSTNCEPRHLSLRGGAGEYALKKTCDAYEEVECVDLGKLFEFTGVEVCDFLKMDIEGEELPILKETPIDHLRRIRAMAMEWHYPKERLAEIQPRLRSAGFKTMIETVGHSKGQIILKAWQP